MPDPRVCTYCGKEADTDDHVPPKNLFAPGTDQLITVDACKACNAGASKDDEYFRAILTMRRDVEGAPSAEYARATAERVWRRPHSRGFATMLASKVTTSMVRTPDGTVFGPEPTVEIDAERVGNVLRRVILGLYRREFGQRLEDGYGAFSCELPRVAESDRDAMVGWFRGRPAKRVGGGEFEYRWAVSADDPSATTWMLRFFDRVIFIGWTCPVDEYGRPRIPV